MPGETLVALYELWVARHRADWYLGTLFNAFIAKGGEIRVVQAGERYVDVGLLGGYREALTLLAGGYVSTYQKAM